MRVALPHVTFVAVMIFLSMFSRLIMSPLLVFVQQDLAVGPARATRLFLTMSVAYSGAMVGSSLFARRVMHRRTIALSAGLVGVGLLGVALAQTLGAMHAACAVMGAGAGLYPPAGVATITSLVTDEIRGRALALHESGPNVAFVLAPLAVSAGLLFGGWRIIPAVAGVGSLVVAVLFDRYSIAGQFTGDRMRLDNIISLVKKGEFWAIMVLFSLAASSTMGVFTILPTFLVTARGYDPGMVNGLISVSRVSGVAMLFLSGVLIDRIGVRRLVALVLVVTGVLTVGVGALSGVPMLAAVFLQPVIITAFFPAAVSAMADLGPANVRNVGVAVIIPVVNVMAGGIFPAVMGRLTEAGLVEAGFVGLGFVILASISMVSLLK